jgi:hypothetical protein
MTLAQKKARENFKKAIAYRKKTGCSLKQAFAHVKGKKVGATKVIERGEKKNAKVTKVLQRVRSKKGTFKGMKKVSGSSHKDTKSHNVNIHVVSGVSKGKEKMLIMWKDIYGKLSAQYVSTKDMKQKKKIAKDLKQAREIIQKLK